MTLQRALPGTAASLAVHKLDGALAASSRPVPPVPGQRVLDEVLPLKLCRVPVSFRQACEFVTDHHRHHEAPKGCKACTGVADDAEVLRGVAIIGRPVARYLADGWTLEVTRVATDGTPNACSLLYRAAWDIARGMGYRRLITYTQEGESGASLRGAGWRVIAKRPARAGWNRPSRPREAKGTEQMPRTLWETG